MPTTNDEQPSTDPRAALLARGRRLEFFTVVWNSLEALIAVVAGLIAGSISLMAFGLDSVIETASGAAVLWRLQSANDDAARRERSERTARNIVGICFVLLAVYVTADALYSLFHREVPERSWLGIAIAAAAVVVMPLLARAKRSVAAQLSSDALHADSRQSDLCAYLSAILLAGLALNAFFGFWWADPAAGLIMVPIIAKEGIDALRGKACTCSDGCHG